MFLKKLKKKKIENDDKKKLNMKKEELFFFFENDENIKGTIEKLYIYEDSIIFKIRMKTSPEGGRIH